MSNKALTVEQWGKLLAKAWRDPKFEDQVKRDPSNTIRNFAKKELGIDDLDFVMTLPPRPSDIMEDMIDHHASKTVHELDQQTSNPSV